MASATDSSRSSGGRLTEDDLLSALPARSANRDVKVGLFVLIGLIAFFTVLFTFTDVGTFRGRYYVRTQVTDAGGMRRGDPVQMRGVNIGRVVAFDMIPGGVEVKLELYDEYPVPEDSRILIKSGGLLGGMIVDIVPGTSPVRVEDGALVPGTSQVSLMGTAAVLGTRADTVLSRITALLSDRTMNAVGESAVEMRSLLAELNQLVARQRTELTALTTSLRSSAAGVEKVTTGPELERSLAHIDSLTARLDDASAHIGRASTSLDTVLGRLARGEGTLGKLSADDALYDNLNAAVTNLRQLVADVRANPKKFLSVSVF